MFRYSSDSVRLGSNTNCRGAERLLFFFGVKVKTQKVKKGEMEVHVGCVGHGEPGSSPVKIVQGLDGQRLAKLLYARIRHPDKFELIALVPARDQDDEPCRNGWLIVRRTDANHGWGAFLTVKLVNASEKPQTQPVEHLRYLCKTTLQFPAGAAKFSCSFMIDPAIANQLQSGHSACIFSNTDAVAGAEYELKDFVVKITVVLLEPSGQGEGTFFLFNSGCTQTLGNVRDFLVAAEGDCSKLTQTNGTLLDFTEYGFINNGANMHERHAQAITRLWRSQERSLLPECKQEMDRIIISPKVMAANPFEAQSRIVCEWVEQHASLYGRETPNRLRQVPRLANLLAPWRVPVLRKATMILSRHADDSAVFGFDEMIQVAIHMCQARRIDCFHQLVQAAHAIVVDLMKGAPGIQGSSVSSPSPSSMPKDELHSILVRRIHQRKEKAFQWTFIIPAREYCRQQGDHVACGDVEVHGAQLYKSLLLATCGIVTDTAPFLFDEAKAGPLFLSDPRFVEQARSFWRAKRAGENYTFRPQSGRVTRPPKTYMDPRVSRL